MNWPEYHLIQNGDVVSIAEWQQYDWLVQGFSLKSAGNVDFRFGDELEVIANRQKISEQFAAPLDHWVTMRQVHTSTIHHAIAIDMNKGTRELESALGATDGLYTSEENMFLLAMAADCCQIFLTDVINHQIGVAHAGRNGTIMNIIGTLVSKMVDAGSAVTNIQAAIGPSIGPCCYEVRRENIEESSDLLSRDVIGKTIYNRMLQDNHFDLWAINELLLQRAGVQTVIRTDLCTQEHNDLFFSHRADEIAGRFAGLIGIK